MKNFTDFMVPKGKTILYDDNFIRNLCSYFPNFVRTGTGYDTVEVSPTEAIRYKGDLTGLLLLKGVAMDLIFPTMLFNGIENSFEYNGEQTRFNVLNRTEVDKIIKNYNVSQKISV